MGDVVVGHLVIEIYGIHFRTPFMQLAATADLGKQSGAQAR